MRTFISIPEAYLWVTPNDRSLQQLSSPLHLPGLEKNQSHKTSAASMISCTDMHTGLAGWWHFVTQTSAFGPQTLQDHSQFTPQITYDFVHPFYPSDTPPHLHKTKWLYNKRMLRITQNCISALSTFLNQSDSRITCYFTGFLCCQEPGEGFSLVCTLCPRCHASSPLKHQTTLFPEKTWEIKPLQLLPKSLNSLTSTFTPFSRIQITL